MWYTRLFAKFYKIKYTFKHDKRFIAEAQAEDYTYFFFFVFSDLVTSVIGSKIQYMHKIFMS